MKSRRLMQPAPGLTTRLILFKVQPSRHAVGPPKSSVAKSACAPDSGPCAHTCYVELAFDVTKDEACARHWRVHQHKILGASSFAMRGCSPSSGWTRGLT